jgi:THAP4-like, heme-binding beta-barrel domain
MPGRSLEDLTSGRTPAIQWNAARIEKLRRRLKHQLEANEVLAASNARKLFSEKHATYARFIAFVRYPQGLRAFFRRSSLLRSGIRVLDAGCGTGAATVAVLDALVHRGVTPGSVHAFVQSAAPADEVAPLARLVGRWTGTSEGQPGKGQVERQYERVLGSKFIQVRSRSTYAPQEKNPKGETHEDIGFFSFDSARKRVVFRQFHIEGFVNQYAIEPASTVDRVVFTSESIENIPAGFRARETYVFSGSDQFEEIFEIAEPGKDFEVYSRSG